MAKVTLVVQNPSDLPHLDFVKESYQTSIKDEVSTWTGTSRSQKLIAAFNLMMGQNKKGVLREYSGISLKELSTPTVDEAELNQYIEAGLTEDRAIEWARWGIPSEVMIPWLEFTKYSWVAIPAINSGFSAKHAITWRASWADYKKKANSSVDVPALGEKKREEVSHLSDQLGVDFDQAFLWSLYDWSAEQITVFLKAGVTVDQVDEVYERFGRRIDAPESIIHIIQDLKDVPSQYVEAFFGE